jgi:hypothetical protein
MMQGNIRLEHKSAARQAFIHYLRTGQRMPERAFGSAQGCREVKFNPYHDPRDGRFTFAPGGTSSRAGVAKRPRARPVGEAFSGRSAAAVRPARTDPAPKALATGFDDGVFRPQRANATVLRPVQFEVESRSRSRSNYDALIRPMTLEQVFPAWTGAAAGAIINPADDFFQITGPARELAAELTKNRTNQLINQIMKIDPNYRFDSLGFPQPPQGMANQLNQLQRVRAATFYRMRGEMRPLQVETFKFLQDSADKAYEDGVRMLREGKLNVRLSPNEALGNYVDGQTRKDFRTLNRWLDIPTGRGQPVQINRRHYDTRENDRTYRIPDVRVGNVAFDMTLTRKTLASPQIRGFFNSDARPEMVIIIRPRQLGPNHTYAIKTPRR